MTATLPAIGRAKGRPGSGRGGGAPGAGGRRPRVVPPTRWLTPTILKVAVGVLVAGALALGWAGHRAVAGQQDALRTIGGETAPDVASANDISFSLADMDANLANYLLVGDRTDLGLSREGTNEIYAERRATVTAQLTTAAGNARDDAERAAVGELLEGIGSFEALAAQARLLSDQGDGSALDAYRQATDLMHDQLLPAAERLSGINVAALDGAYDEARSGAARRLALVVATGVALVAALVAVQLFLYRRTHRVVNPALVACTLVAAGLVVGLTVVLRAGAEDLRAANRDAFASVLALSTARTVAYDANADESRYLIDPQRADDYESAFMARTAQLVDIEGARLDTFDDQFAAGLDRVERSEADEDVTFDGYFGAALRNITFEGERAAALATLDAYAVYQRDDRRIRALETGGEHDEAVRFCLSYDEGDSNWAFTRFDEALTGFRDLNQGHFERFVDRGEDRLRGWGGWALAAAAVIVVLSAIGVRRRLAEYAP